MLAYFIRGISGFGSALVAVPLLALYLPLQFVVPLILVTDVCASVMMSSGTHGHARWQEVWLLLAASAAGIMLGTNLLASLSALPLLTGLGIFVLAFGVHSVLTVQHLHPIARIWAIPAGFMGGAIGALFGTGGPPFAMYLSRRLRDKSQLRATFSMLFLIDGALRVGVFIMAGLLLQDGMFESVLGVLPLMALGLYAGHRVHVALSARHMQRFIGGLLVFSGMSLLWKTWM